MTGPEPRAMLIAGEIPALLWPGQGRGRRPAIISVHGGGGSKRDVEPATADRLRRAGVTLVTFDAYQHGDRAPAGFDMTRARGNLATFLEIIEHTAADLGRVMQFLCEDPAIDARRIGVRGGSMGGYVVLMAVGLGVPAAAVLSICGGADYATMWDLDGAGADRPGVAEIVPRLPAVDPIDHAAAFPPKPVLLIHGIADPIVPIAGQRALFERLAPLYARRPEDCLFFVHAGGHETPAEIERMGWDWLSHSVCHRARLLPVNA